MRAVGLHEDVVVVISRAYQTTCTLVRSQGEAFCIDSPVFPDELEIVPAVAQQAGFGVVGLLATHGDWDHLLGRFAFPEAALGVAETTAARLSGHSGEAVRALRDFDNEHYVQRGQNGTPPALKLGELQALPVPGKIGLAGPDDGSGAAPPSARSSSGSRCPARTSSRRPVAGSNSAYRQVAKRSVSRSPRKPAAWASTRVAGCPSEA